MEVGKWLVGLAMNLAVNGATTTPHRLLYGSDHLRSTIG